MRRIHAVAIVLALLPVLPVDCLLASDQTKVVRVGYQKSGALLLVKLDGSLEKKLASLGYGVEWREFLSGPPIVEAINAGARRPSPTRSSG